MPQLWCLTFPFYEEIIQHSLDVFFLYSCQLNQKEVENIKIINEICSLVAILEANLVSELQTLASQQCGIVS